MKTKTSRPSPSNILPSKIFNIIERSTCKQYRKKLEMLLRLERIRRGIVHAALYALQNEKFQVDEYISKIRKSAIEIYDFQI